MFKAKKDKKTGKLSIKVKKGDKKEEAKEKEEHKGESTEKWYDKKDK